MSGPIGMVRTAWASALDAPWTTSRPSPRRRRRVAALLGTRSHFQGLDRRSSRGRGQCLVSVSGRLRPNGRGRDFMRLQRLCCRHRGRSHYPAQSEDDGLRHRARSRPHLNLDSFASLPAATRGALTNAQARRLCSILPHNSYAKTARRATLSRSCVHAPTRSNTIRRHRGSRNEQMSPVAAALSRPDPPEEVVDLIAEMLALAFQHLRGALDVVSRGRRGVGI